MSDKWLLTSVKQKSQSSLVSWNIIGIQYNLAQILGFLLWKPQLWAMENISKKKPEYNLILPLE